MTSLFCSVHKTEEELRAILAAKEEKLQLKAQRQARQAQDVERKREQREAHKCVGVGCAGGAGSRVRAPTLTATPFQEEEPGRHEAGAGRGRWG